MGKKKVQPDYDFAGWATCANVRCSDGRMIMPNAFQHQDGIEVPVVWNHQHDSPFNCLGHAILYNRPEGVYTYGYLNDTESGQNAKMLLQHGDIDSLSILAVNLDQDSMRNVRHGDIKELSLVLAGANPGAYIEEVIMHGEAVEDSAYIFSGEDIVFPQQNKEDKKMGSKLEHSATTDETIDVEDIIDSLTDEQKDAVYQIIGEIVEQYEDDEEDDEDYDDEDYDDEDDEDYDDEDYDDEDDEDYDDDDVEHSDDLEGDDVMKHNVFDRSTMDDDDVLSHADQEVIFSDAKRYGSLKDSVLAHGITQIDYLFPEAKDMNVPPSFIQRDMGWVQKVMGGVRHTPFSRIKSTFADITEDEARAKGYIKGKMKKEEVFSLLKRSTTPTTIYKKQKLDRDDVVDITSFDVVAWLKTEMRMMLDEELARAFLVGDGRLSSSDDKINEQNIRPIWTDADLYTVKTQVTLPANITDTNRSKAIIRAIIKSRKNYKGSGDPVFYTTEDTLTDMLLIEDNNGRMIYESVEKLRNVLRVRDIVTVPIMEGLTREVGEGSTKQTATLVGIIVNLKDYNVGADKGGAVNMFDDFDIDYNAQKYLIETRCSGALIKPYSAIAVETIPESTTPSTGG